MLIPFLRLRPRIKVSTLKVLRLRVFKTAKGEAILILNKPGRPIIFLTAVVKRVIMIKIISYIYLVI
jgi:hypothetical protein